MSNTRAGVYSTQIDGYKAFIPKSLPPAPGLEYDMELISLLSKADQALGRLDGITRTLPNLDLFVSMYVKKEALLSSQIEGTQASLIEVLETEERQTEDAQEVTNYVKAMNHGIKRMKDDDFPFSLRLIREIHEILLSSGRGCKSSPGEFRRSQNWIGAPGCTINTDSFVPPPPEEMMQALGELEKYLHIQDDTPPLVKIALVHAQFETIHPFIDGNGRIGRLLITFCLIQQGILTEPLLYLSYYFKRRKSQYYESLMAVRDEGKWEEWVKFFLRGVIEVSQESSESAREIDALRSRELKRLNTLGPQSSFNAHRLLDQLFVTPQVSRRSVSKALEISGPTAGALIDRFCGDLGILVDMTPDRQRGKTYLFKEYMDILEVGVE